MSDPWTFGDDEPDPPVRQPLRLVVEDTRTGDRPALDLTAELALDAGTLLNSLISKGDDDRLRLARSLRVLLAALVDDDGVPMDWEPRPADGDRWEAHDGAVYDTRDAALPGLAECSSRRKIATVVEEPRWKVRLDPLEAMAKRIQEAASGARPTAPASPSPRGRGSASRGSRAASGSPRRR